MVSGRVGTVGAASSVGVFAFVLGVLGSWVPSLWYDEVATVYSSRRSIGELIDFLRSTDAVHGGYYFGIHLWGSVFGFSEFSVRLPSAIAVGVAAAGVVTLAARFSDLDVAMFSGVVFALLPRVTWAAVEARSSALTAAAAVWVTVLLLVALSSRSRLWWVAYGVVLTASIVLFVYLATIVVVHFAILLICRRFRVSALPWALAVLAALVVALPFLRVVQRQAGQVGWIPPLDANFARIVFEYQWFLDSPVFGVVFGVVLVVALVFTVRSRERFRSDGGACIAIALVWIAVPMAVMVAYSLVKSPIYLDRYLTFTTPAVALLGGVALGQLRAVRWLPYVAIAALALALVPGYASQRLPGAKPLGMDFSEVNDYARASIGPGDCVLFGRAAWNPSSQRLVEDVDPSAFANARDIGLATDAAESGQLWDVEKPLSDVDLDMCTVLWYFTDRERDEVENLRLTSNDKWALQPYHFEDSSEYALLSSRGLRIDSRVTFDGTQVVRLVR